MHANMNFKVLLLKEESLMASELKSLKNKGKDWSGQTGFPVKSLV